MPLPAPASAQQAPQQQSAPSMGVSPVSGPTPNKGLEAAAMQKLGSVAMTLHEIVGLIGPTSEMGQKVNKMVMEIAKMVPPGAVSPAGQQNEIRSMMMKNEQNRSAMGGGGGMGGGMPPGGAQPSAPPGMPPMQPGA